MYLTYFLIQPNIVHSITVRYLQQTGKASDRASFQIHLPFAPVADVTAISQSEGRHFHGLAGIGM